MAVNAGARYVNTTLWGIGERAGNCGLATFTAAAARLGNTSCAVEARKALELERLAATLLPQKSMNGWGKHLEVQLWHAPLRLVAAQASFVLCLRRVSRCDAGSYG